jgi:hypothetical protein
MPRIERHEKQPALRSRAGDGVDSCASSTTTGAERAAGEPELREQSAGEPVRQAL